MKIVYKLDRQVENNVNYIIAIDESMFAHIANQQIWIIGLININTKKWRLEIVTDKSLNTLKLIITNHVDSENSIYTDIWRGYTFSGHINSRYQHYTSNHSIRKFGLTLRIEGIWSALKNDMNKIYQTIQGNNFVYFLSEAEYRWNIKDLNNTNKIQNFANFLFTLKDGDKIEYLSEDELTGIEYEAYYDD